jgi:hypothetical protein
MNHPEVALKSLDTLWFQVGGTVCNLACTHCFVSCSPTNHTHELLTLAEVRRYLEEAARLGVREYYFTGGEPFLNPEMEAILAATLEVGPATVLTNGLPLDPATDAGKTRFFDLLRSMGIERPRLKVLPVFRIGAEVERGGAYESWQRLREGEVEEGALDHLQCGSCRMVTDQGVWVCPILVNEPSAKMGETIADTLGAFPLDHPACWTCHVYGVSCRT